MTPSQAQVAPAALTAPSRWTDITRAESWAGEVRVNLIRLAAIALFYGRHLIEVFTSPADAPVRGHYHVVVTAITLSWAIMAILLHAWLSRRRLRWWVKYAAVAIDVLMITLICAISATSPAPASPLVLLYFAVIASAPLRLSLRLVWFATAGAMAGYLCLLGYYAWYLIGFHTYYAMPALRIPRSTEIIMLLSLLSCGLFAGQAVRQIRRMIGTGAVIAA